MTETGSMEAAGEWVTVYYIFKNDVITDFLLLQRRLMIFHCMAAPLK